MCDSDGNIDRNSGSDIYVNGNIDINGHGDSNRDRNGNTRLRNGIQLYRPCSCDHGQRSGWC